MNHFQRISTKKKAIALPESFKRPWISPAWLFLAMAIASEVIGLTVMKASASRGHVQGYVVLYLLIALSYYFLSKAVKTIAIGVAYAIWEGSGIALITLVSAIVFQHGLSLREWTGLAMAIIGILMINAGELHSDSPSSCANHCESASDV